jgi:hypothetical protein
MSTEALIILGAIALVGIILYFRKPDVATPEAIKQIEDRLRAAILERRAAATPASPTVIVTPAPTPQPYTPQPPLPGYGPLPPSAPYAGPPRTQAEAIAWYDAQPYFTQMQMPNPHARPWFDAQGRRLDSLGNVIVDPVVVDVPVPPPRTPEDAEARRVFEQQTLTAQQSGDAYARARATFDDEFQFATWLRGIYARRGG